MPKIVRFHATGSAGVLKLEDVPVAEPGTGEVRLKVEAIGLNRAEVMFRQGRYLEDPELPSRLGYEAAGIVDAVGAGIDHLHIGERVSTIPSFSMGRYGVYGESAVVPAHAVAHYPECLSAVQGASIWMQYLTAYGALIEIGRLAADQRVLITAASSSVGLAAIQIVKAAGAVAVATTRSAEKKDVLLAAGADEVIVTDAEDLAEKVRAGVAADGAGLIFDPVGGPFLEALAAVAAPGATIFEYGALFPGPTVFPLSAALKKGLIIRGYTLFEIVADPQRLARGKEYVRTGLVSGALSPVIDRTFPLESIVDAHRYMEANQQKGKIVVTV